MSKTSETKNKILELLKSGNKRLIDLYPILDLSPATVSQHLKELREMGLIEEMDNSHFKNEKYYTLNKNYAMNQYATNKPLKNQFTKIGLGSIVVILIAAGLVFSLSGSYPSSQKAQLSTLNILLTDPPHVPIGTQALNITYSSIQIRLANASGGGWLDVNATGKIDLLSIVNVSKLIGSVKIPSNTAIESAAFNITEASIAIGNESYPVYLSSNRVIGQVDNSRLFNGTSDLLVDFSPTIITMYNDNSTTFELVPSLKAVMVARQQFSTPISGEPRQFALNGNVSRGLNASGAKIAITYENITSQGNLTSIRIVVKDTSNQSVELSHVLIFGNESLYMNPDSIRTYLMNERNLSGGPMAAGMGNGMFAARAAPGMGRMQQGGIGANGTWNQEAGSRYNFTNAYNWSSGRVNYSWVRISNAPPPQPNGAWAKVDGFFNVPVSMNPDQDPRMATGVQLAYNMGTAKQSLGVLAFVIESNGTISLPLHPGLSPSQGWGYTLSPGENVTLTFNGSIGLGSGLVTANFTKGAKYKVDVIGSDGACAESELSTN